MLLKRSTSCNCTFIFFLGLSDKVSARYIDPAVQKHVADLANAALKDEQANINATNSAPQFVDTVNSAQTVDSNFQNSSFHTSTSSTPLNNLDFSNSSADILRSQTSTDTLSSTNSMLDSGTSSGSSVSDIASGCQKK